MKVLIVSKAFTNAMYRQKLSEMSRLGLEVVAVSPPEWMEGGSRQRLERTEDGSYELRVLPMRFNGHFHLHYYAGLSRLIHDVGPDLLQMDEEPYNLATFLGVLEASKRDIPAVFFTWQNLHRRYPPPFSDMERAVYRWSSAAIAGNQEAAAVLRAKGYAGPLRVIPQFGVDPERFAPGEPPDGPFTVGFFNRLIPAKGPVETLEAVARLPGDARLLMVGDGPLRERILARASELGLTHRVTIKPRVDSRAMPQLMRSVHAVVLPSAATRSWKEQFGRVLIEAMASGVPVAGSSSGEIPNVIGDGGLVFPEGDTAAYAACLRRLYDDPTLRCELGRRGRQRVLAHFTHRRVAEETVAVYREALGERTSVAG